jgi:predicted ester cyclase
MKKVSVIVAGFIIVILLNSVCIAAAEKNTAAGNDPKETVKPFYTKCLTVNPETNVADLLGKLLADDFQSVGSVDVKNKAQLIGQLQFFWKMIPDMKWEIQEMLQDGDRVIVRSLATGSPKGDFMGLSTDGSKSFKIMSIDIHTVKEGRVVRSYHIEDWMTAMMQLKK